MLTYFQDFDKSFNGIPAPKQVPVCASYCEAYFNACRDDKICFQDIVTGIVTGINDTFAKKQKKKSKLVEVSRTWSPSK